MSNEKKIILHSVTNEEHNSFVGLRIRNDEIHFYYPESYNLSDVSDKKSFRNDIINIIRTISLAKSKTTTNNTYNNGFTFSEQFAIMSYLWIIRDYISNGYYRNSEKFTALTKKVKSIGKKL